MEAETLNADTSRGAAAKTEIEPADPGRRTLVLPVGAVGLGRRARRFLMGVWRAAKVRLRLRP